MPSALQYFRPMRPGETIQYEFFYQPGETAVYPCLDEVAFLLKPTGVGLHWIVDHMFGDWSRLALDNIVENPKGQKRDELPLKAGAWNAVTLETIGPITVKITLNGVPAFESENRPGPVAVLGCFIIKIAPRRACATSFLPGPGKRRSRSMKPGSPPSRAAPPKPAPAVPEFGSPILRPRPQKWSLAAAEPQTTPVGVAAISTTAA